MKNDMLENFLVESKYVNYNDPLIQEKVRELFEGAEGDVEKARIAYAFVRDQIPHSYDIHADTVNARASDVLKNRTGVCHAKSNLLAALLRSQGIPAGFCFQRLTLADDDSLGYCIHAYNAVWLDNHWIKLDARGNKPGVQAEFSLTNPILAYPCRKQFGEYHIPGIFAKPRAASMQLLDTAKDIDEVMATCTSDFVQKPDVQEITMRGFEENDMDVFRSWLEKPYVAKYYHNPENWVDELEKRDGEYHWVTHLIVELGGRAIGFCQYYPYEPSIAYGENWHGMVPVEYTYSIDYLIGEEEFLRKGFGKEIVLSLIQMIQQEGNAKRIIVQPEEANLPSCNTLRSGGFFYDEENKLYRMNLK